MVDIRSFDSEKLHQIAKFPEIDYLPISEQVTLPDIFKEEKYIKVDTVTKLDGSTKEKSSSAYTTDNPSHIGVLDLMPRKTRVNILMAKNIRQIASISSSFTNPEILFDKYTGSFLQVLFPKYHIHPDNAVELKHRHDIKLNVNNLADLAVTIRVNKDTHVKAFITYEDPYNSYLDPIDMGYNKSSSKKRQFKIQLIKTDDTYALNLKCNRNLILFHLIVTASLINKKIPIYVSFQITSLTKYIPKTPITIITTKTEHIRKKKMIELFRSIINKMSFEWNIGEGLLYLKRNPEGPREITEELVEYNPFDLHITAEICNKYGYLELGSYTTSVCISNREWS